MKEAEMLPFIFFRISAFLELLLVISMIFG
jgi:hypothetical protein